MEEKLIKLAEILSEKFGETLMCAIIGRASDSEIEKLIAEYE